MSATTSSGSIQTRLGRRMCRFIGGGPLFAVAVITRCEDKLQVFDPHRATFENAQTRSAQDGNHIVQLDMTVAMAKVREKTLPFPSALSEVNDKHTSARLQNPSHFAGTLFA